MKQTFKSIRPVVAKEESSRWPPADGEAKAAAGFRAHQGSQGLDALVSSSMPLYGIKGAVAQIPNRQLHMFFVGFDAIQKVAQVCACANTYVRSSNVANVLYADRMHASRLLHHVDQTNISAH